MLYRYRLYLQDGSGLARPTTCYSTSAFPRLRTKHGSVSAATTRRSSPYPVAPPRRECAEALPVGMTRGQPRFGRPGRGGQPPDHRTD